MNKQSLLKQPRSHRLLYKCERIPEGFIKAAAEQSEADLASRKSPHLFKPQHISAETSLVVKHLLGLSVFLSRALTCQTGNLQLIWGKSFVHMTKKCFEN